MKNKNLFLAVLAIILVLGSGIGAAVAYFTSFVEAKGGYVIQLEPKTVINEYYDGQKRVQIQNTAKAGLEPLFVRAKVFYGTEPEITVTVTSAASTWIVEQIPTAAGHKYYLATYTEAVYGQEFADTLSIDVNTKADMKNEEYFDVNVVYECVPAVFKADGTPDLDTAWATGKITVIS